MHQASFPLPLNFRVFSNLFAKLMVREYLRCYRGLKCVVLGINASAGSVLGDAIFVVDVMTMAGIEEGVFGPFGIVGEFPLHEVFVERLLFCGVDAEGSGEAFDASFGEAVGGTDGSFGQGFVPVLFIRFIAVVVFGFGVVVDFYLRVPVFGLEGFFDVREDFLTLSDWVDARTADGIEVLLVGHFGD